MTAWRMMAEGQAGRASAMSEPGPQPGQGEPAAARSGGRRADKASNAADTLLRVALDLFARQDYSTVTIKDIAKETGFNASLIYYYFESKEELFLRAIELTVETAFQKFEAIREQADSPEAVISSWIEIHITHFVLMQKLAKVSLDYASTRNRTQKLDAAIRAFYDKEAIVLGQAIRDGLRQGVFRRTQPRAMAVFISTFLDGTLFRSMMFPEFDYRTAIRHMRSVVLDHLRMGPEGDPPPPAKRLRKRAASSAARPRRSPTRQ
jgi:AcrR family transcriptional regulator